MNIQQALQIEIERETENTRKMISPIEPHHFMWKPHEKSMSLGALAAHIVELHNWVGLSLANDTFDFHTDYKPLEASSAQDLLNILDSGYQQNLALINTMTDAQWAETWTLKAGDHIIVSLPKIGAMRFIIQNHLIHHRGQLSVYLRLLDIPVPGVYGPSADEK